MTALTIKHYNGITKSFVENITNSNKSYYIFVGKPDPWDDDNNPPNANASINSYEQTIYDDIVFGKKLTQYDVAYMIPKHQWTTNTVYARYDQYDPDIYSKNFYVVNDRLEVYKCINNDGNTASIVQPYLPLKLGTFDTSDGYTWKFMYKIDADYYYKFSSNNYIPIAANSTGGTYDINVRQNAVNGTVDAITVVSGGNNYSTYNSGFLAGFINNYSVQLANSASQYNDFYKNSSIYLKTGFGSGQIRQITNYDGLTKRIIVSNKFDVFQNFELANTQGNTNIIEGRTVTQEYQTVAYNYNSNNYFNVGDTVIQTDAPTGSNSFGIGTVVSSNSTILRIGFENSNTFTVNVPIYAAAYSGTQKTPGTVSITTGSNTVTGVGTIFKDTANTLNSQYQVGQYIRIGDSANNNIRRITSIASNTSLQVDYAFNATLVANVHYLMPVAANPTSVTIGRANAVISEVNLNSVKIAYSNTTLAGVVYTAGELVTMVDNANVSQLANGTVSYSNSTTVILNNIQGPAFQTGYYLLGASSLQKSQIDSITSSSNITVRDPLGNFYNNQTIYIRPSSNLAQQVANATLVISYISPNDLTEYVVSPTVVIDGDGDGATAYSIVNTTISTISSIVMVNNGVGYTSANVSVIANSQFGSNASFNSIVSPTPGHGYDPIEELGCKHVSVSTVFQNIAQENYIFPGYGEYRKIGIIEDPLFDDVTITMNTFDRITLSVNNQSGFNFSNGEMVIQYGNVFTVTTASITANDTGFSNTSNTISITNANTLFPVGYRVYYSVPTGNTPISPLTGNTYYYVSFANTSAIALATTFTGSNINIDDARTTNPGEQHVISLTSGAIVNSTAIVSVYNPLTDNQFLELKYVKGSWTNNNLVYGLSSNAVANVITVNTNYFTIESNTEIVYEQNSGATARIEEVSSNTEIVLTDVTGKFKINDTIYDPITNAYANVVSIYTSNNTVDQSSIFGQKFLQTARISLSSVIGTFQNFEYVTQSTSNASGRIISTNNELDIAFSSNTGPFTVGEMVYSTNTNANGIVVFANDTYMKLTSVTGTFYPLDTINSTSSETATVDNVYQVLVLNDVDENNKFQRGSYVITGSNSGAYGQTSTSMPIDYPDLIKNSGGVIYLENMEPFAKSKNTNEKISLIIKF